MTKDAATSKVFGGSAKPDIATKAERDTLVNGRPKPVLETHLEPNGQTHTLVKQRLEHARESRINNLEHRLGKAHAAFRSGYRRAAPDRGR